MSHWSVHLVRRLRTLFRGDEVDRELDDEIRLHIELETEELIRAQGLAPEEARRRALVAFGGVERYRAAHRDARGFVRLDALTRDLRHATRSLRKSPGFFAVSTLTLGLALGLGVTTYAMLDAVRHPYTPVRQPDRVYSVMLWGDGRGTSRSGTSTRTCVVRAGPTKRSRSQSRTASRRLRREDAWTTSW
jgi:uncharacterized ParB-like nuclease family protein